MHNLNQIATDLFKTSIVYKETRQGDAETFDQSPIQAEELLGFKYQIELKDGLNDYL